MPSAGGLIDQWRVGIYGARSICIRTLKSPISGIRSSLEDADDRSLPAPYGMFSARRRESSVIDWGGPLSLPKPRESRPMIDFAAKFSQGLSYEEFLSRHGTDEHRSRWAAVHAAVNLTAAQRELLGGFKRQMQVLCLV